MLPNKPVFNSVNRDIKKAFRYAHIKQGIEFDSDKIFYVSSDNTDEYESSLKPVLAYLESRKQKKTGVSTYYHWPAVKIAEYALVNNISIPENLAIVATSIGNSYLDISPIPISAFWMNKKSLAVNATLRLMDLIEGKDDGKANLDNPYYGKLISRESSCKTPLYPSESGLWSRIGNQSPPKTVKSQS